MKVKLAGAVLVLFAAWSAQAAGHGGGGGGGGHSGGGGGHSSGGSSGGHSSGHSSGGHGSSGHATSRSSGNHYSGSHYSGGHAVVRSSHPADRRVVGGAVPRSVITPGMTGAQNRHPRAGYGTGARYGYGYGSYPYYPYYYPYYGYSGYPWYYPAIGLGFSYYGGGGGYGYSEAPQYYDNQSIAPGGYGDYPEGAPPEAGQQPREDQAPGDEMGPPAGPMGEAMLSVRPDDASVYIDGEFRGTARELARLPLPLGRHHFEVVRPGFRTAELDVDVRADAPARVNIDLQR